MNTVVTRSAAEQRKNSGTIKLVGLTQGEMLALLNALVLRAKVSPVCADVCASVTAAMGAVWPEIVQDAAE